MIAALIDLLGALLTFIEDWRGIFASMADGDHAERWGRYS